MYSEARPLARSQGLIVEELGDELLIYDEKAERAHGLSLAATRVWRRCDGETAADLLGAELDLDSDTVSRALDELAACELLEIPEKASKSAPGYYTRREVTVKMAKVGAAVAATSLIVSVAAPTPAMAATAAFCLQFSGGCCGSSAGCCNQAIGCCCCNPACGSTGCPNDCGDGGGDKWCVPVGPGSDASCRVLCGSSSATGCESL